MLHLQENVALARKCCIGKKILLLVARNCCIRKKMLHWQENVAIARKSLGPIFWSAFARLRDYSSESAPLPHFWKRTRKSQLALLYSMIVHCWSGAWASFPIFGHQKKKGQEEDKANFYNCKWFRYYKKKINSYTRPPRSVFDDDPKKVVLQRRDVAINRISRRWSAANVW